MGLLTRDSRHSCHLGQLFNSCGRRHLGFVVNRRSLQSAEDRKAAALKNVNKIIIKNFFSRVTSTNVLANIYYDTTMICKVK
jgi:hypothetical protein